MFWEKSFCNTLILLAIFNGQAAFADQFKKMPVPPSRAKDQSRNNPMLESNNLREPAQLPDLPEYSGKARFIFGSVHTARTGPNYVMKFHAKEDSREVIDWYRNALQMYKWKVDFSDKQTVSGSSRDGNIVAIAVNDLGAPKNGERTQIEINYFQKATK